ncbi:MAG TPA: hypothetical protein VEB65_07250 [Solirubrobacterales bacterium]|nr:hypothetical protein [Solirubrobacterales bacterium]
MSETATPDPVERPVVEAMLQAAGLDPIRDEREREWLLEMYGLVRPGIAGLYAATGVRYEVPALNFRAEPKLSEWGA